MNRIKKLDNWLDRQCVERFPSTDGIIRWGNTPTWTGLTKSVNLAIVASVIALVCVTIVRALE